MTCMHEHKNSNKGFVVWGCMHLNNLMQQVFSFASGRLHKDCADGFTVT